MPPTFSSVHRDSGSQILWENGELVFRRGWRLSENGQRTAVLIVQPAVEHPSRSSLDRLTHEYELKDQLEAAWAARPLDFVRDAGRIALVIEDANGEPLDKLLIDGMEMGRFLSLAIAITNAVGKLHESGLVHKDIKPANILLNKNTDEVKLTGFGIASRLERERQSPHPPETIAGSLAYMAPEQTGRMNRSIDSRSDLYALGITFYQMLTGALPFNAKDPMEWVHCHLARQPVAPADRIKTILPAVSAIVMKLLAKGAEDRYQTAAGLEKDLCRCQREWEGHRHIEEFPLGEHDSQDRLLIPEKLYGRRREAKTLLSAFDRVVSGGAPELVLVSGYSGIGKSSVVNELQPVLVLPRGLFAAGKFDQYNRDTPYSTLAQAFQSLVRLLLGKSETDLAPWRNSLRETLGSNAGLIVEIVPELEQIIGEPPPVPEVPAQDAQRRFQLVFRQFVGVFARPEHPLALFLDDLQWLDAATMDLLEDLLSRSDLRHLLLIGAYRDNEVTEAHPLMRRLEAIRVRGRVQDIKLGPLELEDVCGLVADSLRCDAEQAAPLAKLVHEKTSGNPFFVIQFLYLLAEEGLVAFDYEQSQWLFDLSAIQTRQYTDNVISLLAEKLTRLPRDTQDALQQLACLGNSADIQMLSIVLEAPEEQVHATLWEGLRQQLIEQSGRSYRFVHDRVQEAAYVQIPDMLRIEAHVKIGRILFAHTSPEKRDVAIFEIVNQLNRGAPLITTEDERELLAELNLAAGIRAKGSSAYTSALMYLSAGAAALPKDAWERRQELAFEIEIHSADCQICLGALQDAEKLLEALGTRSASTLQQCAVACRRVDLYTMIGESERAIIIGLECLRRVGIDLPEHPTEGETRTEYERIWSLLGSRAIEDIIDLPLMQDPEARATLDMLVRLSMPALYTDHNLYALTVCKATNLTLERGNSDAAPYSYAIVGLIASARFGDHDEGYRLAKMACDLLERHRWTRYGVRTYFFFAQVIPWTRPLDEAIAQGAHAFHLAREQGDPSFAGFTSRFLTNTLLARGRPLDQVERQADEGTEFVRQFGFVLDRISPTGGVARTLRGKTAKFGSLDDDGLTEVSFEQSFTGHPTRAFTECYYWTRKLRARFFSQDYAAAVDAADKAEKLRAISPNISLFPTEMCEFHFYAALVRAAQCAPIGADFYPKHLEALQRHEELLRTWAINCPENFECRALLVSAEIARIQERVLDAMDLYERAIVAARAGGSTNNEAIANELASRFYAARGFETIAKAYLREARFCYLRWGADGKVRHLESLHPFLREAESAPAAGATIETPIEGLDFAAVVKASQAVSSEAVLEKSIEALMRLAIEHAGAERGLLFLLRDKVLQLEAEAMIDGNNIAVSRQNAVAAMLPEAIVHYVARTREIVLLDDASVHPKNISDSYIRERNARSVLCLPLLCEAKVIGVLYLENNMAPGVFTPNRVTVLKVLASQAAISIENAHLYGDLTNREGKIRRLLEANILGICVWNLEGAIVEANEALLHLLQYERGDVSSGRLRWTELTPPEWHERDEHAVAELSTLGSFQPFEKEFFRKDGSRIPVLIGGTLFEESANEGVAFVLDLSGQKMAEKAAREGEERFRDYAETASDWFWEIGPDYKYTLLTENAFGSDPTHRIGTSCWDAALDLETEPEKWKLIWETLEARKPFRNFIYRGKGPNDSSMYVRASGKPVFDSKGEFLGYRGTGSDVTAIVQAQEALRESEQSLRSTIDGIPGLVAILAPNGEVEAVNRRILDYCGQSLNELKNWGTNGTIHQEDFSNFADDFGRLIAVGAAYAFETRLRRFDGEYRWFDVRGIPVRDASECIVRWYSVLTDVHERRCAEEALSLARAELTHASRVMTLGALTASIAHEVNQPLSGIITNAGTCLRMLSADPPNVVGARATATRMLRDGNRASDIIKRLRAMFTQGERTAEFLDLNDATRELLALSSSELQRQGVFVRTDFDEGLPTIAGDRVQLQQVILNLVLNAADAMKTVYDRPRNLLVATARDGDCVRVSVCDSGIGLGLQNTEKFFEAFYTTKSDGMGIGLSISRSIIESHEGLIWAANNEGPGATFSFSIPVSQN